MDGDRRGGSQHQNGSRWVGCDSRSDPPERRETDSSPSSRSLQVQSVNPGKESPRMTGSRLQIPGYEILAEIGKGAMGVVYKARQASVDRIVAIKVLRDGAAKDREYIARFRREATI